MRQVISKKVNLSFHERIFPHKFKITKVIQLHKSAKTDDISNHIPISMLSDLSKICERVMYGIVHALLTENNILSEFQFCF